MPRLPRSGWRWRRCHRSPPARRRAACQCELPGAVRYAVSCVLLPLPSGRLQQRGIDQFIYEQRQQRGVLCDAGLGMDTRQSQPDPISANAAFSGSSTVAPRFPIIAASFVYNMTFAEGEDIAARTVEFAANSLACHLAGRNSGSTAGQSFERASPLARHASQWSSTSGTRPYPAIRPIFYDVTPGFSGKRFRRETRQLIIPGKLSSPGKGGRRSIWLRPLDGGFRYCDH